MRIRDKENREPVLWLEKFGNSVLLKATGTDGCQWTILRINEDGTLKRVKNIGSNAGFRLTNDNKILGVD